MNQSCFLSGLQVPICPVWARHHLTLHSASGLMGSSGTCPLCLLTVLSLLPSTIPSCVCLCSVEHSLLIAEWLNSNPNPDTGGSTPEAFRWEVASTGPWQAAPGDAAPATAHWARLPFLSWPNSPCDLSAPFATATSRPPASLWSM